MDEDCPGEGGPYHERQQQAGVGHGQVGAPGQALRGQLDESLLHWTHIRPDDGGNDILVLITSSFTSLESAYILPCFLLRWN